VEKRARRSEGKRKSLAERAARSVSHPKIWPDDARYL
jgi:hypothetical protein